MRKLRYLVVWLVGLGLVLGPAGAARAEGPVPTGERTIGNVTLEPGYDDMSGNIVYVLTPNKVSVPLQSNPTSWEDFFVVVYPITSTLTLNCMHKPMDNCPDHGPEVAGAAMAIKPGVYGAGVLGHDHVFHVPGPPGGEFNANWAVKLVLFNSFSDADKNLHLTTVDQIMAAQASGKVTIFDTPTSFLCAVVPAALYQRATPVTPVPGIP